MIRSDDLIGHPDAAQLIAELEGLAQVVWRSGPAGRPWETGALGRDWLRYQAGAVAAIEAAAAALAVRPTTIDQRLSLLLHLRGRLLASVAVAAERLDSRLWGDREDGLYRTALRRQAGA